ncbi:hypothetical protein LOW71_002240 [Vibrio vulnificus]|nr:hypothetical protein [Vibrio vulnificus]
MTTLEKELASWEESVKGFDFIQRANSVIEFIKQYEESVSQSQLGVQSTSQVNL